MQKVVILKAWKKDWLDGLENSKNNTEPSVKRSMTNFE